MAFEEDEVPQDEPQNEFIDLIRRDKEERRSLLERSLYVGSKIEPKAAVDALNLSSKTGIPADTILRDATAAKEAAAEPSENEFLKLLERAPKTAQWLQDPHKAAAVRPDLYGLSYLEELSRQAEKPPYTPASDEELRKIVTPEMQLRAVKDFAAQGQRFRVVDPFSGAPKYPQGFATEQYKTRPEMEEAYIQGAIKSLRRKQSFLAGDTEHINWFERAYEAATLGASAGVGTQELGRYGIEAMMQRATPEVRTQIKAIEGQLAETPTGTNFASSFLYPTAKIIGQMADMFWQAKERAAEGALFGATAAMIGGPAAPATVPLGTLGGAEIGFYAGLAEQTYLTEAGNAYLELEKVRGKNGEQLDETTMYSAAGFVGTANATLEMVGMKLLAAPFKAAAKRFFVEGVKDAVLVPTARKALLTTAREYATAVGGEVATEVLQEGVNIFSEEVSKMATSGQFDTLANSPAERAAAIERLAGIASETFRGTALLGLPGEVTHLAAMKRQADHTSKILGEMQTRIKNSEMLSKHPELAREVIGIQTDGTGAGTLSMPVEAWDGYFSGKKDAQGAPVDPRAIYQQVTGDAAYYDEAKRTLGELLIPTKDYLTSPVLEEGRTFFQKEVRFNPMEMNQRETESLLSEQEKDAAAARVAESLSGERVQAIAKRVAKKEAVSQLADLKKSDLIAQVKDAFGRVYWLSESGKQNREELNALPSDLIGDLNRVSKEGRQYAAPIDEVAARFGMDSEELIAALKQAELGRQKASERVTSEEIPEHIYGAVGEAEFQKALEQNLSEAEADAKLVAAVETRKKKQATLASVQKVADQIKQALEAAGFKQQAAVYAKKVAAVFKTLGEREGIDPYALFSERPLTIERNTEAVSGEGQTFNQPNRGEIRIGASKINIDLLKNADASTFLHETGHLYLDLLGRLALRSEASEQLKADWQAVKEWLGATSDTLTKEQHEQWAEGFERYLMEGKAPSKSLRGAFYRFKEWLTEVYQAVKETLRADLSDSIRGVMDRLLATDQEIDAARQEMGYQPLFEDAKKAGATDAQANRYVQLIQNAKESAEASLLKKAMRQAKQEREQWYEDERGKIRKAVEKEVNDEPIYRAVAALQKNERPDGTPLETPAIKIDKSTMPPGVPLKGPLRGITSDTGHHLDSVAGMLGFPSGKEMIDALQRMEPRKDKIERVTTERTLAEFGAEPTDQEIKEAAMASIHNEDHVEQLILEMQIAGNNLGKLAAGALPNMKMVRKEAERAVNGQGLKNINPKIYLAAERRAQKKAAEAYGKGDIPTFLAERRVQIVNHESYVAAQKVMDEQAAFLEDIKKVQKSDERLAKSRDMDVVNGIRAVLARVNLGPSEKSSSSYLEGLKQYNEAAYESITRMIEESVPENVRGGNKEFSDLTAAEFRDMRKVIDALWDISGKARQFEIQGKKMDLVEDVVKPLVVRADEIAPHKPRNASLTKWDGLKRGALFLNAARRRVEHWTDAMGGQFRKLISDKMHDATNAHNEYKVKYLKEYEAILKELGPLDKTPITAPELGFTFNGGKRELLGAMLHTGNAELGDSNLWKLLLGASKDHKAWGALDELGNLDRSAWDKFVTRLQREGILTKKDYDYLQAVWNLNERMKPDAQRAHKALNGYYFDEVTATPFQTPWGEYKGGYVPAFADPVEVSDAARRQEQMEASVGQGFSYPTTGAGSTMKRSASYWRPLLMDLNSVPRHIDWASRYANLEPVVADLRKLFSNREFRERMEAFNPAVFDALLTPWLSRAALQQVEKPMASKWGKATGAVAHWLKNIAGIRQLGLNFVNAAQNAEGLALASIKTGESNLLSAMKDYFLSPIESHRKIREDSIFMRHRSQEVVGQMIDTADDILNDANLIQKSNRWTRKHVYFFSKLTQGIVDDITYLAGYNKAYAANVGKMTDEEAHKAAIAEAEHTVRTTQGSSAAEDLSTIEAGNAWARLFTMYTSWFNMRANLLESETLKTIRESGLSKSKARLFYLYAMGMMAPALIGATIFKLARGKDLDEDDDGYLDDLLAWFFGSQGRDFAAMVPFAGPIGERVVNTFDDNPANDAITVSPALNTLEQMVRTPSEVYRKLADDKGRASKVADDTMTAFTAITGIPVAALARPVKYSLDVREGYAEPQNALDVIRGALTGYGAGKK